MAADLGWHVIHGETFLDALRRCAEGEDPDLVFAELYANADQEEEGEPASQESLDWLERTYVETHEVIDGEQPVCIGQWCCGCEEHPVGKPWGWNCDRWQRHYEDHHPDPEEAP